MTQLQVVREPLHRTGPDCRTTYGDLARRVGCDLGLVPDDEQQAALDAIFAEKAPGIPAARHAAIVGPRQNIKTSTLVIAAATDLYVFGIPEAVWTAHQSKTATKSFQDLRRRIKGHHEYDKITDFLAGRGEEMIYLPGTPVSLEFRARSGGSGRGFTTDRLTLDEWLFGRAGDLGALLPTMLTRPGAQVRYGSSGRMKTSDALRELCKRGIAGNDPGLFYVEYGAERRPCADEMCSHKWGEVEGCALDDRELWWQSNSALWCGRITEDEILDLRKNLTDPLEFMRECLCWHEDPPEGSDIIDLNLWGDLADAGVEMPPDNMTWSLEVAPGRGSASIGASWWAATGPHLSLAKQGAGTDWVLGWLEKAAEKRQSYTVVLDQATEAASFKKALEDKGFSVVSIGGRDRSAACGNFYDLTVQRGLSHDGQAAIAAALGNACWRVNEEGSRTFSRKAAGDISPLYALVLALFGIAPAGDPTIVFA